MIWIYVHFIIVYFKPSNQNTKKITYILTYIYIYIYNLKKWGIIYKKNILKNGT